MSLTRLLLQTVFIRSVECNAANIYKARQFILAVSSRAVYHADYQLADSLSDPLSFGELYVHDIYYTSQSCVVYAVCL